MLVLIYGDDDFRVNLRIKELIKEKQAEFELLENPSLNQLSAKLQETGNLLLQKSSDHLIVRTSNLFSQKQDDKELDFFLKVVKEVAINKEIIIQADSFKGTTKLSKELKKIPTAKIEQIKAFKSWDQKFCVDWLEQALKTHTQIKVSKRDLIEYVNYLGCENSANLFNELDRIAISNPKIDMDIIRKHCLAKYDIFEFIKYLAKNDKPKAIEELKKIQTDKNQENNLGFLSLIQNNINLYQTVLLLSQERFSDEQIADVINAKSTRVYHLKKDTAVMDKQYLEGLTKKLLDFETRIKTGSMKFMDALNLLVHFEVS